MLGFRKKVLQDINLGHELKTWREKRGLTAEQVADAGSIQTKYILALERGDYSALPEPIYAKNFLKTYLKILGLKQDKFLRIFDYEWETFHKTKKLDNPMVVKSQIKSRHFIATPRVIKIFLASLVGLVIIGYLLWQVNYLLKPPMLTVNQPIDDLITTEAQVTIVGQTHPEAILTVNDQNVVTDDQGNFEYDLGLQRGLNIVTIEARKRHSRAEVVYKKIILQTEQFN